MFFYEQIGFYKWIYCAPLTTLIFSLASLARTLKTSSAKNFFARSQLSKFFCLLRLQPSKFSPLSSLARPSEFSRSRRSRNTQKIFLASLPTPKVFSLAHNLQNFLARSLTCQPSKCSRSRRSLVTLKILFLAWFAQPSVRSGVVFSGVQRGPLYKLG